MSITIRFRLQCFVPVGTVVSQATHPNPKGKERLGGVACETIGTGVNLL